MEPRDETPIPSAPPPLSWEGDADIRAALANALASPSMSGRSTDEALQRLTARLQTDNSAARPKVANAPRREAPNTRGIHQTYRRGSRWSGVSFRQTLGFGVVALAAVAFVAGVSNRWRVFPWQAPAASIYQAAAGQYRTVQLADGSKMTLAPATTARVLGTTVTLQGDAYFDVMHRRGRSFTVNTKNAVVRVLGTRFSVRQYPNESASQVMVETGKVALQRAGQVSRGHDTVLVAHMMGRVSDSSITVTSGTAVMDYSTWSEQRLVFEGAPLGDVITELSRVYGVEVRIADSSLAKRSMTMKVSVASQSLRQVLDIIGLANDAHYTKVDSAFILVPGRIATRMPKSKLIPQLERQYGL